MTGGAEFSGSSGQRAMVFPLAHPLAHPLASDGWGRSYFCKKKQKNPQERQNTPLQSRASPATPQSRVSPNPSQSRGGGGSGAGVRRREDGARRRWLRQARGGGGRPGRRAGACGRLEGRGHRAGGAGACMGGRAVGRRATGARRRRGRRRPWSCSRRAPAWVPCRRPLPLMLLGTGPRYYFPLLHF
jgi:hypothetical protein